MKVLNTTNCWSEGVNANLLSMYISWPENLLIFGLVTPVTIKLWDKFSVYKVSPGNTALLFKDWRTNFPSSFATIVNSLPPPEVVTLLSTGKFTGSNESTSIP